MNARGNATFPAESWERAEPSEAGMNPAKLADAGEWLRERAGQEGIYRAVAWICPGLDLVVAQHPGLYRGKEECERGLIGKVAAACRG